MNNTGKIKLKRKPKLLVKGINKKHRPIEPGRGRPKKVCVILPHDLFVAYKLFSARNEVTGGVVLTRALEQLLDRGWDG